MNEHANFQSFWGSMMTIMRCSTGEAWNYIMHDDALRGDGCVPDPPYDRGVCGFQGSDPTTCVPINGCGSGLAQLFFTTFTLVVTFVMLNMFIGVVLEGFSESNDNEDASLTEEQFESFVSLWTKFDPEATCFIHGTELYDFLQVLPRPMGFGEEYHATQRQLHAVISAMGLPTYNDSQVFFGDVAVGCAKRMLEQARDDFNQETFAVPTHHKINEQWTKKFKGVDEMQSQFTIQHAYAAEAIADTFRVFQLRQLLLSRARECNWVAAAPSKKTV